MIHTNTNTRILANDFEYFAPKSLTEALELLEQLKDENVKILAGGTDLLVKMKTIDLSIDSMVNIKGIPELNFIDSSKGLSLGATIPFSHIIKEKKVKTQYLALYEAIVNIAAPAIRNMGTIAGNIGNASPAADTVPPLIAFDGQVTIVAKGSKRTVPLEDIFLGPGKTILKSNELITQIDLPELKPNTGSAFLKKSRVKADLAKINLAVSLHREGQRCDKCRIVFGSVAATVVRAENTERFLEGKIITDELITRASREVADEIKPIDDIRSTAEYRIAMSKEMLKEALLLAWTRANSDKNCNSKDGGE